MSILIINIIKSSLFASIGILLIRMLKDRVLKKYTYKLNYIICILITLRMLLIFDFKIYIPSEFLKIQAISNVAKTGSSINNSTNYVILIFSVWIIGAMIVMIKNLTSQILFYKKIENITNNVTEDRVLCILEDEKYNLNIKSNISVFSIDGLSSPMLIGIFNNKIIIPNRNYSGNELKWIFKHELTHFKRKDNVFKLLLTTASAIHWFNPLISEFKLYIEDQCELSCDEFVLNKSKIEDSKEYALTLLNTLKYGNSIESNMFSSALNTASQVDIIKNRIEGILNNKKRKKGNCLVVCLIMTILVSILSFNMTVSAYENVESEYLDLKNEFETNGKVTIEKDNESYIYEKVILNK